MFGFREGIKTLRLKWQLKREVQIYRHVILVQNMLKMGDSLDETEHFYFTAGWIFAVQFFLPPEPMMLSSESIMHKPDTSSASTLASLQIIQQVCRHHTPHMVSYGNYMWQM